MKIIKAGKDHIATIVGEMLNIECGMLLYVDGVLCESPELAPKGYPKLIDGPLQYTIKASSGYIYLAVGMNLVKIEKAIVKQLAKMVVELKKHGVVPLKTLHSVKSSYHTNVKVVTSQMVNKDSTTQNQHVPRGGFNNILRQFTLQPAAMPLNGRFTWHLRHINSFEWGIMSNEMGEAISRNLCSVFYDKFDVLTLKHNETTNDFSKTHFKNHSKIISSTVTLFEHGHPLTFELNAHWITNYDLLPEFQKKMRNLTRNVYRCEYTDVQLKPVKIAPNVTSTDVCSKCRCLLWGENYVLAEPKFDRKSELCTALCTMCLHTSPSSNPIEDRYNRTFRVMFPRTAVQMLQNPDIDTARRDILSAAAQNVEKCRVRFAKRGSEEQYTKIGDTYASFASTDTFLYSNFPDHPEFANRQIFALKVV